MGKTAKMILAKEEMIIQTEIYYFLQTIKKSVILDVLKYFENLKIHILYNIFDYLDLQDIFNISALSKNFFNKDFKGYFYMFVEYKDFTVIKRKNKNMFYI
jgi:hypothetical protein